MLEQSIKAKFESIKQCPICNTELTKISYQNDAIACPNDVDSYTDKFHFWLVNNVSEDYPLLLSYKIENKIIQILHDRVVVVYPEPEIILFNHAIDDIDVLFSKIFKFFDLC
ncbi:MAG: hypothetical protein LC122_12040 [Chitinophagales bacterium]|nr:hypothetical protein [Chitinophagales bacterium]